MKYILTFILLLFFSACSKNVKTEEDNTITETNQTQYTQNKNKKKNDITLIKLDNLSLKFKNNTLIYPKQKTIILFDNNNTYSKAQELVLKKLKTTYHKTNLTYLEKYFNIQIYPTIVVLDKNKTIKYENFTPYEILKTEGF